MKNKSTFYLFMFALISMISLSGTFILANSANYNIATGKSNAKISGPSEACQDAAGSVYATETGMQDYQWSVVPDGIITAGHNPSEIAISWEATGDHKVSVTYTDPTNIGTVFSGTIEVSVSMIPGDPQPITGPERVCRGETGITYTIPPVMYATEYVWVVPPGTTIISGETSNAIKVSYSLSATSGYVRVYGKNFCGQGNVSAFFPIAVHEIPSTPHVNLDGDLLHSSSVDGNQWFRDGAMIPNAIKRDFQVTQNGRYWSMVTLGGCTSAASNKMDVDLSVSEVKMLDESGFSIYPIPNNGKFNITCQGRDISGMKINIYNSLGASVYQQDNIQWDSNASYYIDLNSVPSGLYSVVLQNDRYHIARTILIKNQ